MLRFGITITTVVFAEKMATPEREMRTGIGPFQAGTCHLKGSVALYLVWASSRGASQGELDKVGYRHHQIHKFWIPSDRNGISRRKRFSGTSEIAVTPTVSPRLNR
jgi:hypothetical protein